MIQGASSKHYFLSNAISVKLETPRLISQSLHFFVRGKIYIPIASLRISPMTEPILSIVIFHLGDDI